LLKRTLFRYLGYEHVVQDGCRHHEPAKKAIVDAVVDLMKAEEKGNTQTVLRGVRWVMYTPRPTPFSADIVGLIQDDLWGGTSQRQNITTAIVSAIKPVFAQVCPMPENK